jgi:hypothetical protein
MSADFLSPLDPNTDLVKIRRERIIALYLYWNEKRGERTMPRRADIDPADFVEHLPGIILIDIEGENERNQGIFRYRVVGTREVANRQSDPTGRLVEEGFFAESVEIVLRAYESVRIHRAPIFEPISFVTSEGVRIEEESIMLPLSENGTDVSQILVYSEGHDAKGPAQLHPTVSDIGTTDFPATA